MIKLSGLRPRRELYEELLSGSENSLPTYQENDKRNINNKPVLIVV